MPFEFTFPDVGEGIHEGTLQKWLVKEGDSVTADQPLAEVETDKAVVEMPSPKTGTIGKLHFKQGDTVQVGQVIVTILLEGESAESSTAPVTESEQTTHSDEQKKSEEKHESVEVETPKSSPSDNVEQPVPEIPPVQVSEEKKPHTQSEGGEEKKSAPYTGSVVGFVEEADTVTPIIQNGKPVEARESAQVQKTSSGASDSQRVKASPMVRKKAQEKGIDLSSVTGSGPGGVITLQDLEGGPKEHVSESAAQEAPKPVEAEVEHTESVKEKQQPENTHIEKLDLYGEVERVPLKGIRKVIATHMSESMQKAPQLTNFHEADVTKLIALRSSLKEQYAGEGLKLTYLPFFIKAVQKALVNHPRLNASVEEDAIVQKKYYNIGVATDTPQGLIVPVLKDVDKMDIKEITKRGGELFEKTRERKMDLADLKGGTFTISNIGSVGGGYFTPILNYPEVAILGVGLFMDKVVVRDGQFVATKVVPLSLTYDHRVVDGSHAAAFIAEVISMIESPENI